MLTLNLKCRNDLGLGSVINAHINLTFPTTVCGESVVNLDAQIGGGDLSMRSSTYQCEYSLGNGLGDKYCTK